MNKLLIVFFMMMGHFLNAQQLEIKVYGNCGMCQERIETAAKSTIGVEKAHWDSDTKILSVQYQMGLFNEQELHQNLAKVGHDTDKVKAQDEVYNGLHSCCQYREHENESVFEDHADHENHDHESNEYLNGIIAEINAQGEEIPLIGATVQWLGDQDGEITDLEGYFSIKRAKNTELVVTYVGYANDTILIEGNSDVKIIMENNVQLDGVEVSANVSSSQISYIETIKVTKVSEKELMKAACCNLSESFETIPSVDVSTTDAVTGKRRIEMLGLAGPYVQITMENMPFARGLSSVNGLSYIPGPWVQGMMINQGSGSVVNGYESISGQINIELKKPDEKDQYFFNLFANEGGRYEFNATSRAKVNDNWSTALLVHGSTLQKNHDRNEDGFLDMPKNKTLSAVNRWKYYSDSGVMGQIGISAYTDNAVGGQVDFNPNSSDRSKIWGADLDTKRFGIWAKRGQVFDNENHKSLGLQFAANYQKQDSYFGVRNYDGTEKSLYFNAIYQTDINQNGHSIKYGASYNYDNIDEKLVDDSYIRNESVVGAFTEYTYAKDDIFTLVAGLRYDYHNDYKSFVTPRLHIRFAPNESFVIRANAGIGRRTPNAIADNLGYLASNRIFIIKSENENTPYGLKQEIATDIGGSITKSFSLFGNEAVISVEAHRINFTNQAVVDVDVSPQSVIISNLNGKSYANSFQTLFEFRPISRLATRLAYRYNDVKTAYQDGLLQKPLNSAHRAFANFEIDFGKSWSFDYTFNWQSDQRLPITGSNPEEFRLSERTNSFFVSNFQITKSWNQVFDLYFGAENIFDQRLENPIVDAAHPFSPYFDASMVWGPIFGRNIYLGLRYRISN
ncbi:MAG TPA: TonB-dependent receptor [Saprospiraceae bacterium]|nr:TonB-dependent receptor [Saprospiraceae bacterium]HRX29868.1 TonB-dependent receptor [Saprospiraceae bacterium]